MVMTNKTILVGVLAGAALLLSLQAQADDVKLTTSDLPIVIIQTPDAINADDKVPGTMQIIDNGPGQINTVSDAPNAFDGHIGIKLRGESSLNFNQKKYTLETWDALGNDSVVSIFGMPEESDWVLLAPYNDVSMVRDVYAFALWNEMGHWGPRTRMCEVIVNGGYRGVYAFTERIKRDKNRVDISKLKADDVSGRDLTGGYIVRIDAYDEEDLTFQSKVMGIQKSSWSWSGNQQQEAPVTWSIYYPKKEDIVEAQKEYIQNYLDSVRASRYRPMTDDGPAFALAEKIRTFQGLIELHWTQLQPDSPLAGHSIGESGIRARTGTSIVGVIHEGKVDANPRPDTVLQAGDLIAAIGNAEQIAEFARLTRSAMAASPESAATLADPS